MKKIIVTVLFYHLITAMYSQDKNQEIMEKRTINPWSWQESLSYNQAVEVKNVSGTLYVSGQAAINDAGESSAADMKTQLELAINNLERVISEAGYQSGNIVRLNVYTTSVEEFFTNYPILQEWMAKHGVQQATSLIQVVALTQTLTVELEATVVK